MVLEALDIRREEMNPYKKLQVARALFRWSMYRRRRIVNKRKEYQPTPYIPNNKLKMQGKPMRSSRSRR